MDIADVDMAEVDENCDLESYDDQYEHNTSIQHQSVKIPINRNQLYLMNILRSKAVVSIDENYSRFLIQDFDSERNALKKKTFQFVKRQFAQFTSGSVWLYSCTCNDDRRKFLKSLTKELSESITVREYEHEYSKQRVTLKALKDFEDPLILLSMNEEDEAVIGVDHKGFSCTRCTFGKHTCRHINMLNAELDGEQAAIPDCLVDFKSVHEGTLLHAAKDGVDGSLLLIPDFDDEECNICGTNYDFNFLWKCGVKLVTRSCVRLVHVPERKCPNCKHVQNFCGYARGLLNMGEFIIGHDVLKDYMFRFLTGNR
eukprot:gene1968-2240_t